MLKLKTVSGAALASALLIAACASPPKEETIYIDPDTGQAYTDEDASEEAKQIADLLQQFSQPEAPDDLADDDIWDVDAGGNFTHIQSGLICPATWSGMHRTAETIYDRQGQDVGCNFVSADGAVVTFYAYRSNMSVTDEVEDIMDQIVKARNPVHEDSSIPTMSNQDNAFAFEAAAITFAAADGTPLKSGLALMDSAGWRVKARVTYPLAVADEVETFIGISMLGQHDRITTRQNQLALDTLPDDSI